MPTQGLRSASVQECTPDSPKSRARQHMLPLVSRALEAHHSAPFEPSGAACAPLVDTSNTRISAAAQAPAGSSRWFSVLHRLFRVDLDHSAPRRRTSSVIMMVPPAPARRDHLALTGSACTPPAGSCTAARQWGEQKRSIDHSAEEKRILRCTVKRDCARHERRRRNRRGRGRSHRHSTPLSCTELRLKSTRISVYLNTPYARRGCTLPQGC